MEQSKSGREHYEQVFYPQYDGHRYCTALRSIDTVRALHQTVVSLRGALDESRQEIEKLKRQIIINSEIQDARPCHHPDIGSQSIDYKTLGDKVSELEKIYYKSHPKDEVTSAIDATSCDAQNESVKDVDHKSKSDAKKTSQFSLVPHISISTQNLNDTTTHSTGNGGTNNQMASRIDVKIKVSSNINVDSNDSSTGTSERSASPQPQSEPDTKDDDDKSSTKDAQPKRENPKVEVEMYEDSNTNTFNVDAKNLKIKVTSEDNINITKSSDRICIHQSSSEYLNLDIDDMSEGDNSVFTEGATTPIEQRLQQVEDVGSDNDEASNEDGELPREERDENEYIVEEVDDIELIFSSDDNKDVIQEDLVSLSEYEPWQEDADNGMPVLTKFSTLTSEDRDREAYYEKKKALKAARISKAKEKSLSVESHRGVRDKSIESTDSLSFDNPAAVDYKSSSLDKDSSLDNTISRDPSFDTFAKHTQEMGKKWTNVNVLIETDMSKVGIGDENILDMGRRNTCPNPPLYRPLGHRSSFRTPLATKYPRSPRNHCPLMATKSFKESGAVSKNGGVKCTSSAQTDISALPHQWRSETHLVGADYCLGGFTLPSKYNAPRSSNRSGKNSLRLSERTQEARRILLSDINFTSMVPELSRSADHLCQQKINEEADEDDDYFKGNLLKTPDYTRGVTPSTSMVASPGVSQWTVNESTTQTEAYWHDRGESFDSSKDYSLRSGNSMNVLNKHHRSRSVPSIRCAVCKQNHHTMKPSESMHYATRTVTFQEPTQKIRGSLPDLRHDCTCPRRYAGGRVALYRMHESSGSTESLLEEADEFVRHCNDDATAGGVVKKSNRRCSEADIQRDFHPSKQSLPFLPKSPKCLKPGQLAKVIAKTGRVVVGRIRYCGPVASADSDETYVGLQLPNALGDSDGSCGGIKFFECENNFGLFVPFKKVIMAWNS